MKNTPKYSNLQNIYYNRKIKQSIDTYNQIEILNDYITNIIDLPENSDRERVVVNIRLFDGLKNDLKEIIKTNIEEKPPKPPKTADEKHKAQLKCLNYALDDTNVKELIIKLNGIYPVVEKIKKVLNEFKMIKMFDRTVSTRVPLLTTVVELYIPVKGPLVKIDESKKVENLIIGLSPYFEGLKLSLLIPLYKQLNDFVEQFKSDFEETYKMSEMIKLIDNKKNAIISLVRTNNLKADINIDIPTALRETFAEDTVIKYDRMESIIKSVNEHWKQYDMKIYTEADERNRRKDKYTQFKNDISKNSELIKLLDKILTQRKPAPPSIASPITQPIVPLNRSNQSIASLIRNNQPIAPLTTTPS
jgi:hypothetical protein